MTSLPLLGTLAGASGDALAVSPDGRTVVAASASHAWCWRDGELVGSSALSTSPGGPIRFDGDRWVLVGAHRLDSIDGSVSEPVLDLELVTSGLEFERRTSPRFSTLGPIAWSADGSRVITSHRFTPSKGIDDDVENPGPDGQVVLIDPASRSLIAVLTDLDRLRTFAVVAGESIVAATTPEIRTWDLDGVATGGEHRTPPRVLGANELAIGPADRLLAVARGYGGVELVVDESGVGSTTAAVHRNGTSAVVFHPSEPLVVSGGRDGSVALWRIEGTELVLEGEFETDDRVRSLAYDATGERLFVALRDTIAVVDPGASR
jgi:WD40 repeat protein